MDDWMSGARMTTVTIDKLERGRRIDEAVKARKKEKLTAAYLARSAKISIGSYYNVIKGIGGEEMFEALEEALEEWDNHPEDRFAAPSILQTATTTVDGIIEIEMFGVYGVDRVVARGPVTDPEALVSTVEGILRRLPRVV